MHKAVRTTASFSALLVATGALSVGALTPAAAASEINATATTTVNIRSGPSTTKKIVGGLVRGQRISAIGKPAAGWSRVHFDGGTAYVSSRYLNLSGKNAPAAPTKISAAGVKVVTLTLNVRSGPGVKNAVVGTLAEGSDLRLTGQQSGGYAQTTYAKKLRWVSVQYLASSTKKSAVVVAPTPVATSPSSKGATALAFAKKQLGKPYKFGATGPKSYDCSGLTQAAWRSAGVTLPRTAAQQYKGGGTRITKSKLRPGDLVFFYSQTPSHVAIYAGDGKVIHAPRPGKKVEYIKMSYMPYAGAVRPG